VAAHSTTDTKPTPNQNGNLAASVTVPGVAQLYPEANGLGHKTTAERAETMKEMCSVVYSAPLLVRMEYYGAMEEILDFKPVSRKIRAIRLICWAVKRPWLFRNDSWWPGN
jgi:hypothetical protein